MPKAKLIGGCLASLLAIGFMMWFGALLQLAPEEETEEWQGWHSRPHYTAPPQPLSSMQSSLCEGALGYCAASSETSAAKNGTSGLLAASAGVAADDFVNGTSANLERPEGIGLDDFALLDAGVRGSRYGRGVSIIDIDNDGWEDLWLCASPTRKSLPGRATAWRNIGNGHFVPWDNLLPTAVNAYSNWGAVWFDYDNDGDSDLLLINGGYEIEVSQPVLLQNMLIETGQTALRDVSNRVGSLDQTRWGGGAKFLPESLFQLWWGGAAVDFNSDGFSDFIITNTNSQRHWKDLREEVSNWQVFANGLRRPWALFQNMKDGTFVDVSSTVLPWGVPTKWNNELKNPVWLDVNLDGSPDLFIAGSPVLHFVYNPAVGRFRDATDDLLWEGRSHEFPPTTAKKFKKRLAFSACTADFNQDGFDDLYLGYWSLPDLVMTGGPDGRLASAFLIDKDLRAAAKVTHGQPESARFKTFKKYENTMGLTCGDLDHDGFPEAFVGTGTPTWGNYDFILCNKGNSSGSWQGLRRCEQGHLEAGVLGRGHGQTRSHGIALGDLNGDGAIEIVYNNGGFATSDLGIPEGLEEILIDAEVHAEAKSMQQQAKRQRDAHSLAQLNNCTWPPPRHAYRTDFRCDTREEVAVYAVAREAAEARKKRTAYLRLIGAGGRGGSNRDAFGARLTLTAGNSWRRHAVVHSAQGFQSQSSAWMSLCLGPHKQGQIQIQWPSGRRNSLVVQAGSRQVVAETFA